MTSSSVRYSNSDNSLESYTTQPGFNLGVVSIWLHVLHNRIQIKKTNYLSKYSLQERATPSWIIPMATTTSFFTSGSQTISNFQTKCLATAINASLGHLCNQLIVQPLIRPGNFNARLRNFSPTYG